MSFCLQETKITPEATHIDKILWTYNIFIFIFIFKCRMLTENNSATFSVSLWLYLSIICLKKIKHLPKINQLYISYIQLHTLLVALEINFFFHCWRSCQSLMFLYTLYHDPQNILVFSFKKDIQYQWNYKGTTLLSRYFLVIRTDTPIITLNCLFVCIRRIEKKSASSYVLWNVFNAYFLFYLCSLILIEIILFLCTH